MWLAAVCSLIASAPPISRLLSPRATRPRIWTSRADSPSGSAAAPAALPDGLSAREVQILGLVARGLSNREIGGALSISEHTAANHIRSILRKTGSANRTQAASYAHRHGLLRA